MYRFDLEKNNDLTKAARAVLAHSPEDQPWEAYRGDMLCLHGDSIKWLAERSIRNEPSLGYTKYVPFAGIE